MKKYLFCILIFIVASQAEAQYFYKDLWTQTQLAKEFAILKEEKLRTITVKSFEDNGSPSEGFFLERKIDKEFRNSETVSRTSFSDESILNTTIDENGRVTRSVDSSQHSVGITEYTYDKKGKITSVVTITREPGDSVSIIEERAYSYNEKGLPQKIVRKKNGMNMGDITFVTDSTNNVVEEIDNTGKKFYYYYDRNRLTDVVRYNSVAKRLLPDYMISYNSGGRITQQVNVTEGTGNYFIWKYTYNDYGLKETEKVYSKERRLLGTVEYTYK